jgi:DMSO/TMAO reductase YedYZ molybdopterin-dependent catalytic subunit
MTDGGLRDERTYREVRSEEIVWTEARRLGLSRKRFLQMLASGAGATAVAGNVRVAAAQQGGSTNPAQSGEYADWFVKPAPAEYFIDHGHAKEMRWEVMKDRGYKVPNELFYMQAHFPVPRIDASTYRLRIDGPGVERAVELTYDDLLAMPSVTLTRALECGENGRTFFAIYTRRQMDGAQWKFGAVGVADWTGVPLGAVLERAGLKRSAVDVMPVGLDGSGEWAGMAARPMPVDRALAEDTLLVYGMNGQPLPADHGFPIRALVPGWIGPASVKWVGRIEVSEAPVMSMFTTEYGVMKGPAYPPVPPSTTGQIVTWQNVKSAFELPWEAALPAGRQVISGRSWSGRSNIARVEVSLDGGATWQLARLREPNEPACWTQWDVEWDAVPGRYAFRARATDGLGNRQPEPDQVPFNESGYLFDGVVDHPVRVF